MKKEVIKTNDAKHSLEVGMEYAYHQAIIALKELHEYSSKTVQTLAALIYLSFGCEQYPQDNSESIDERTEFADDYTDRLFAQENVFVDMYGQAGFDFLVKAVLCFGGFNAEEIMREYE